MNAVKVDSAKRIRLTVLTPGDYYEPEVRGGDAEEITLRRMPPPRRRFTRLEALRAIEKSPLRFLFQHNVYVTETGRFVLNVKPIPLILHPKRIRSCVTSRSSSHWLPQRRCRRTHPRPTA